MRPITGARLDLSRDAVLALRRRVGFLDHRLPAGAASLVQAAWAGLQDSMPRAALLSLHARVAGVGAQAWEDPALVQLWGPRFSAFVVPAEGVGPFSLGTLPDSAAGQRRAQELAAQLAAVLAGRRLPYGEAGHALGIDPNRLRYASATGTVRLRWDGARQSLVWTVPPPAMTAASARLELCRRYVHVYGPTTAGAFSQWAGLPVRSAARAFLALGSELVPVATPIGDAWMLARDEEAARAPATPPAPARLLPSGDPFLLRQGADRALLVPDPAQRSALWPTRVWPGGVLLKGELAGTWRRAGATVAVEPWRGLADSERRAIAAEVSALPLAGPLKVQWGGASAQ